MYAHRTEGITVSSRRLRFEPRLLLAPVCLAFLLLVATLQAHGQARLEPTSEAGGVGTHLLLGAIGGRLELDDAPRVDALGGRIGVGFGELVQLTGFHWKSVDVSDRPRVPGRATGAEVQLNLNAGFGLTPFLSAGAARLRVDTVSQNAAIAGAGILLPLGPVLLRATVQDYILGVSGFRSADSPEGTTHNWMLGVGLTAAFGRGRPQRPVATTGVVPVTVTRATGDTGLRNYQSERRVEIPLPLEGSITIRYGPDAQPVVVAGQPATATQSAETAPLVSDPALQNWLRQEIALQLAEEVRRQRALTGGVVGSAATVERITDDVLATLLPQMQVSDARRTAELREELRRLLSSQLAVAPASELAAAPPRSTVAPVSGVEPGRNEAGQGFPREEMLRVRLEREARVRARLSEITSLQPALLSAAETERGPALVVSDGAFAPGTPLLTPAGRAALSRALELLPLSEGTIFVQGHIDAGTELQSQRESELRAEAVRALLVQQGIDPVRVYAIGYGRGRPVAGSATAEGRALNRRVEIVLSSDAVPPAGVSP